MLRDIRFAFRALLRQRFVSLMVILCLGLVIGANVTVFGIVRSYLLRPLPFADYERLALMWERELTATEGGGPTSVANFRDYRERNTTFEQLEAVTGQNFNLTGDGPPERAVAQIATPGLLPMLGTEAALGRLFTAEEGEPVGGKTVVLEHDFWQHRYGGDPSVIGSTVLLDKEAYEIVGVLPESFEFINWNVGIWLPLVIDPSDADREQRTLGLILGKLKPGVTSQQAQDDVARIAEQLAREYPEANEGYTARAQTLREQIPGPTDTQLFAMIQAAGLFVLLIACANIANLLLSRGQVRQRELALRSALGAGRRRLVRQLLTESVVLAVLGGGLGVGLGTLGVRYLRSALAGALPRAIMPVVDSWVLTFALAITVGAGLLFGLIPAIQASRGRLGDILREHGGRGAAGSGRRVAANVFVVAQVALALALLCGTGLLLRTFLDVQFGQDGFEKEGILTFQLTLPEGQYDDAAKASFQRRLLESLEAIPGVESAASTVALPRGRNVPISILELPGREQPEEAKPRVSWLAVSPGYLDTLRITRLRGRDLDIQDRGDSPKVAVVDQGFVERFFPDQEPLGQRIGVRNEMWEIVGVVSAVRQRRIGVIDGPTATVYLPYAQKPTRSSAFVVKLEGGDPESVAEPVREAVWALDPDLPVANLMTLPDYINLQLRGLDVFSTIVGGFAAFALLLAALGIYAVLAYSVTQRTQEIGVRMAMGAGRRDVLLMVLRQGGLLIGIGLALGLPMVFLVERLVAGMLGALSASPVVLLPAITATLIVTAIFASLLPARRASALPPTEALRFD